MLAERLLLSIYFRQEELAKAAPSVVRRLMGLFPAFFAH
jgi:hypothetical protein